MSGQMAKAITDLRQAVEHVSLLESQTAYTDAIGKYEMNIVTTGTVCYRKLAEQVADSFSRNSRRNVKVLDVAAGTGLVAVSLKDDGFVHIDALEPNAAMLEEARKRRRYENYYLEYLAANAQSSIQTGSYDVVTACGVFAKSAHLDTGVLEEIIRVTKSGGYFVIVNRFTGNEDVIGQVDESMDALEAEKMWTRITREVWPDYNPLTGDYGIMWKYQVL